MQNSPAIIQNTIASATSSAGTYVYPMQGVALASLQLNCTLSGSDSSTITLKLSNDNVNFMTFATSKTASISSASSGYFIFELGQIDYAYLQVSWTAPSTHTLTIVGLLNSVPVYTQQVI